MRLTVNGKQTEASARTLAQLCTQLGYGDMRIATAVNTDFIPAAQREKTLLHEHDHIEIVAPRQGG